MRKIRKGDHVVVICGSCKGKKGIILRVLTKKNRVIVEGINMIKCHIKPNPNKGIDGGIIQKESSIHISNVSILNKNTQKHDSVGIKYQYTSDDKKKKIRYFKSDNNSIDELHVSGVKK